MSIEFGPAEPQNPDGPVAPLTGQPGTGTFSVSGGGISAVLQQITADATLAYAALDKVNAAYARSEAAARKAAAASKEAADGFKLSGDAADEAAGKIAPLAGALGRISTAAQNTTGNLNGLASAQGQANDALGQGIGFMGQATILSVQFVQATEAQTKALQDELAAQNELNDVQKNTLNTMKSWNDTLAIMVDTYKRGTTGVLEYIRGLKEFETNLLQMYGSATGKAKEALDSMIAMIEKLIATASGGNSTGSGNLGVDSLDRAFGGGGKP